MGNKQPTVYWEGQAMSIPAPEKLKCHNQGLLRYLTSTPSLALFVSSPFSALLTYWKPLNLSPWSKIHCLFRLKKTTYNRLFQTYYLESRENRAVNNLIRYDYHGKIFLISPLPWISFGSNPRDHISSGNMSVRLIKIKALLKKKKSTFNAIVTSVQN